MKPQGKPPCCPQRHMQSSSKEVGQLVVQQYELPGNISSTYYTGHTVKCFVLSSAHHSTSFIYEMILALSMGQLLYVTKVVDEDCISSNVIVL